MQPQLTVAVAEQTARHAVVRAAGNIDMHTTPELDRVLSSLLSEGCHRLVVDLSEVEFCDSTGLSAFVHAHSQTQQHLDGGVALVGMQSAVRKVFGISGLAELLSSHATIAEALAAEDGETGDPHQPSE